MQGITAREFIDQVLEHNPHLKAKPKPILAAEEVYRFPENVQGGTEVVWTQPLTGFAGSRWDAWTSYVRDKVKGISWESFMEEALIHNPGLEPDDARLFRREKFYLLPENRTSARHMLFRWSDAQGRFAFEGLHAREL